MRHGTIVPCRLPRTEASWCGRLAGGQADPWLPAGFGSRLGWGPAGADRPPLSACPAASTAILDTAVGDFTVTVEAGHTACASLQDKRSGAQRAVAAIDWHLGQVRPNALGPALGSDGLVAGTGRWALAIAPSCGDDQSVGIA